ncbi:MAG: hypothetical protein AAFR12_08410 [Cyanobacteria bacterium J06626_6]
MVFATDYDPLDPQRRKAELQKGKLHKRQPMQRTARSEDAGLNRDHQTDQLIEKAYQLQQDVLEQDPPDIDVAKRQWDPVAQPVRQNDPPVQTASVSPLSIKRKPSLPFWLQLLNRSQQFSTVVTSLLVTGALALYGSTVYADKSTDRALSQLDALQNESQQITTANEAIKQSLAEQAAREDSGLELYESGDVLFLTPEPVREPKTVEIEEPARLQPLGY